eukprot:1141087-Pelagomonas_calceolata.AAC.5
MSPNRSRSLDVNVKAWSSLLCFLRKNPPNPLLPLSASRRYTAIRSGFCKKGWAMLCVDRLPNADAGPGRDPSRFKILPTPKKHLSQKKHVAEPLEEGCQLWNADIVLDSKRCLQSNCNSNLSILHATFWLA